MLVAKLLAVVLKLQVAGPLNDAVTDGFAVFQACCKRSKQGNSRTNRSNSCNCTLVDLQLAHAEAVRTEHGVQQKLQGSSTSSGTALMC